MRELEGVGAIWRLFKRHEPLRAVLPFALLGGIVLWLLDSWVARSLDPTASALLDGVLMSAYVGGLLFVIARAALRVAESERAALRASEDRFRNLTRLSADWF